MRGIIGLLGRSLGHSYSPLIHAELGCPDYRLIELEPHELADFFASGQLGGLNVTIPYKRTVLPFCAALSQEAERIGCVNTIVCRNGALYGHNSDAFGFRYALRRAGIELKGRRVVIFGSGGASLTAQYVARFDGAESVAVISRTGQDNYVNLSRHCDAEVLINATPLGMYPDTGALAADPGIFARCAAVVDMVYNPARTAFIQRAEALGLRHTNGLPMLVAQAAESEAMFTGRAVSECEIERIIGLIRRQTENIVLIGMPGCGKSSVGRALARLTGREAVDLDELISARHGGKPAGQVLSEQGEESFRAEESRAAEEAGKRSGIIIAAGGGTVTRERNYAPLHQNGRIYQLERSLFLLPKEGRPISQSVDPGELYARRKPMYQRFRDSVVWNDRGIEYTAEAVWRDFCESTCN